MSVLKLKVYTLKYDVHNLFAYSSNLDYLLRTKNSASFSGYMLLRL